MVTTGSGFTGWRSATRSDKSPRDMLNFLPHGSILLLVLLASTAMGKEREPHSRNIYLSDDPGDEVPSVYVAGAMATVLRFNQLVDPARTKLVGWEGRFEPLLASGHLVIVMPLKDLSAEDRVLLVVTLQNGKELPFTMTAQAERFDHQVNVRPDDESPETLQSRLAQTQAREQLLERENGRYRKEETSIDHALATLLAKDAVKMTPFSQKWVQLLKDPRGTEFLVSTFANKKDNKVAVVFNVKNNSPTESWSFLEARLTTEERGEQKPFALRATQVYWAPSGTSGTVAVVIDGSAFDSKNDSEQLVLELFRRGTGIREAWVFLNRELLR